MRVLGIDTSSKTGAFGFIDGEQVVFTEQVKIRPGGSEKIPALLLEAFMDVGRKLDELELIAVGVGPGSYTGVRVGLAIAKGMAFGLRIPLVGVSTLQALATNIQKCSVLICPLAKSRKGEVYAGLYQKHEGFLEELAPPAIWKLEGLAVALQEKERPVIISGEDLEEEQAYLSSILKAQASYGIGKENLVDGARLARLGWVEWEKNKENQLYTALPLYLRRTEAEVRWEERSCRVDV